MEVQHSSHTTSTRLSARKRVLVTGSNGLLGQKLLDKLKLLPGIELLATSRGEDRYPDKTGYQYEDLDVTDEQAVQHVISNFSPQCIIHTAAMTNVDQCESSIQACRELNVKAVSYLINGAEAVGSHFIHLSTDFIFDGKNGPYRETDQPSPLSVYGHSKLESEKIVEAYSGKWCIIRTIIVYGIVKDMSRSNIVLWAKEALSKNKQITVVDDQFRSPTLAEDLADACIAAALKESLGIFNVCGKDFMSILELVERVADHYKLDKGLIKPIKSDSLNQAAKRPARTGFNIEKAIHQLDYCPHSFEEGMEILDLQLANIS